MNRRELLALLPTPESIKTDEYTVIHNFLVDAVNDWVAYTDEDVTEFVTTVLIEIREWSTYITNLIERINASEVITAE